MSHAIFVLFPIPFRIFSKSNDFNSMVSVGNPVAFIKSDKKKDAVAQADLSDLSFIDSLFRKRLQCIKSREYILFIFS